MPLTQIIISHTHTPIQCWSMPCPCKAMRRSGGIQGQHAAAAPFRFVPLAPRIDPLLNSSLLQIHCFCYWIWMDATGKGRCSAWSSTASACSVRRTTKNALASSHPENQGTTLFVRPLDQLADTVRSSLFLFFSTKE